MNTFLIILAIFGIVAAIYLYKIITGHVKDTDGDFIPDVIEEKVEEVKQKVKAVKKEVAEVKTAAKKVTKEAKDVIEVVKKPTKKRGRPAGSTNKQKKTK